MARHRQVSLFDNRYLAAPRAGALIERFPVVPIAVDGKMNVKIHNSHMPNLSTGWYLVRHRCRWRGIGVAVILYSMQADGEQHHLSLSARHPRRQQRESGRYGSLSDFR
jgi:hypothetical protein